MQSVELGGAQLLLALIRALFVGCVLSSFGAALFVSTVASPILERLPDADAAGSIRRRCRLLLGWSLLGAGLAGMAWLMLEAGAIVDAEAIGQALAAVPPVLLGTSFGQTLSLQLLSLLAVGATMAAHRQAGILAACLAGAATLLEAGHSHAFAMAHGLSPLLVSQALHLLAAGAWLGGLLPLLIVVKGAPLGIASLIARRFSALGIGAVVTLAVTAFFQGWVLGGGLPGLTGTPYGAVLFIKAALFVALIAIAVRNRLRIVPALASRSGEGSRRALVQSIALETILGACVVMAAGVLGSLEPGMHVV